MTFSQNAFGLIADGNRRWARRKGLSVHEGHEKGFSVVKDIVLKSLKDDPDWDTLVVYGFSTENWKRSPLEVRNLMKLYQSMAESWGPDLLKQGVVFHHAGRRDRLPKSLITKLKDLEQKTQKGQAFRLILCLDYGSQDEIARAVEQGGTDFEAYLEVPPLDLILRSGGEQRLSNFCLYQAAYSEFVFHEKYLPELSEEDMHQILQNFKARDRRKGQ